MRTYVFSKKERETVNALLNGEELPSLTLARLKYRIKTFKTLQSDVQLYLQVSKKLTQS
jgi:hypothetical protein